VRNLVSGSSDTVTLQAENLTTGEIVQRTVEVA